MKIVRKLQCKEICIRHKGLGRYSPGNKRCKNCDLFIKWMDYRVHVADIN
jgi:hypothetical protein